MEPEIEVLSVGSATSNGFFSNGFKRVKIANDAKEFCGKAPKAVSTSIPNATEQKKQKTSSKVNEFSDPFAISDFLDGLECGKFGSATKDIGDLIARKKRMLHPYFAVDPKLVNVLLDTNKKQSKEAKVEDQQSNSSAHHDIIPLDDDKVVIKASSAAEPVVIIDSDDEENVDQSPSYPFQEIILPRPSVQPPIDIVVRNGVEINACRVEEGLAGEVNLMKDKGVYVGVEEEEEEESGSPYAEDDGLDEIWKEMKMSLEFSQDPAVDFSSHEHDRENGEDCDHSFVLKDDLGYVCRVCGVIDRGIETIFEFQYNKGKRSTRTYISDHWSTKGKDSNDPTVKLSVDDLMVTEVSAHPRHMKQMKPHQVEGFNFLVSNLVSENPGGCILAHAPGSGKTFMIISFMQSFLAKYPNARPLVVLPKGILATWKKEFKIWQVEDIPLLDFYTIKADNRSQQLEVLKQWVDQRSILFLGYKQLSTIVCESKSNKISASCQEILLKAPSILILDEGHTPRNENTDVLQSLAKVQTPRKVVLSGTLYQNHVKEVFNILNLVRPKFLRMETSRTVIKRIMSRVHVPAVRKQIKGGVDTAFFDLVEYTLQKDEDFRRKVTIIQDLREMTSRVLHYYKGDFLDELPGLHDFTVLLNLSTRQVKEVKELRKHVRKFKISSKGSAVYVHPNLSAVSETNIMSADYKVDEVLENLNVSDGVKAKFVLNMLKLCDSTGEKLLVFSPYLLPLKFLERLAVKTKGWSLGKEIFVISGESSADEREWSMDRFNNSSDAKVFFGSIKACGEGISLVGASRVIILDVHLNPSVTRQAIGRAFRPGQKKKVFTYRLVAAESPEEEDHYTCFKKELIAKMWFEWNEYCGYRDFEVETVDMNDCGDDFLESPLLREDVKVLYKR